ncbi:hypothetical protein CRG98_020244 [Punica granatum]|uniref:Uncharacterized protein n=1 Tax=Punica granatum TaxID=22663 RepID=A0A2I0JV75_PUNGR|nr:hypothetical protein CRG98_020244 [Punica granatum]
MHAELRAVREERDRLRCELVDSRAEVADYRELQTKLTRARSRVAHLDREMARVLPAYSGAPSIHLPPPTSSGAPLLQAPLMSPASDDQARIAALEGTVNQMATNMAELLALLRGPNRAFSSSTPPPGTRANNRADSLDSADSGPGEHGGARTTNTAYVHGSPFHQPISTTTGPHGRPSSTGNLPILGARPVRASACLHAGPSHGLHSTSADGFPSA